MNHSVDKFDRPTIIGPGVGLGRRGYLLRLI